MNDNDKILDVIAKNIILLSDKRLKKKTLPHFIFACVVILISGFVVHILPVFIMIAIAMTIFTFSITDYYGNQIKEHYIEVVEELAEVLNNSEDEYKDAIEILWKLTKDEEI